MASGKTHHGAVLAFNQQGAFSESFAATEAGLYLIMVRGNPSSAADAIAFEVRVNGSLVAHQAAPAGSPLVTMHTTSLNTGDVVSVALEGSATSYLAFSGWQVVQLS